MAETLQLHVAPAPLGRDTFDGRSAQASGGGASGPFATLGRAREEIRRLRRAGQARGRVEVVLRGGIYELGETFELGAEDSGTPEAPVVYRAAAGERPRLIGGRVLGAWSAVADAAVLARLEPAARAQVRQIDLRAMGIADFGQYHPRGHGGGSNHSALELFADGEPMCVARWPKPSPLFNNGFEPILDFKDGYLVHGSDRPARWAPAQDIHLHGYFALDWASTILRAREIDAPGRRVALDPPGGGHYGVRRGGRFFFFNILEEITGPGDYCVDRARGMLYCWPRREAGEAIVSTLNGPLIRLEEASHVLFERLTLEAMWGDGVLIRGGRGVRVAGCVLRNIGRHGVRIEGGRGHAVESCDISQTGEAGVIIDAGDPLTLTPCEHRVHNCHMHHIAREGWTYFGAIDLTGVGARATHNRVHDHRHAAVFFRGVELAVEFNEFYNVAMEGDDCGVMYTGRRLEWQGNKVRFNYLHHVGDSGRNEWGTSGVYMDDGAGGTEVYGNVFHHVRKGVQAGGGINTRIRNNLFVECRPAIWFDQRIASARADRGETMLHGYMKEQFYAVRAHEGPYLERYPLMAMCHEALQRGVGIEPRGSEITRNIAWRCGGAWVSSHWVAFPDWFPYRDNLVEQDPKLVDAAMGDFALRADSPAPGAIGFEPIPFERIGLVRDAYRTAIEDVRTRIEAVRAPGADGTPGRGRLVVRNIGDVVVEGVEIIELKLQAHGPGFAYVEVPYRVAPGEEAGFEFEFRASPQRLRGLYELFLYSRGERLRPSWTTMPLAFKVESELKLLAPCEGGESGRAGRVRLEARNAGAERTRQALDLRVEPAEAGVVVGEGKLEVDLAPGASASGEFAFEARPGAFPARLTLRTVGADLKPAELKVIVEYRLGAIAPDVGIEGLRAAMAGQPAWPLRRPQRIGERTVHVADARVAVSGDRLALALVVRDGNVTLTDMLWDGSSIELYGCSPDRERIGHVFGNLELGQVFLAPALGATPARAYRFIDNGLRPLDDVAVRTRAVPGGYELEALVPLKELGVNAAEGRFLFEMMAQTGPVVQMGNSQDRATLFGSRDAYKESAGYAMLLLPGRGA